MANKVGNSDAALSTPAVRGAEVTILVVFGIYVFTLAPTVTLEQSGALAVAGEHLGVGRVPGYPVWHLCARVFVSLFSFVTYRGQPNPAWALNFMSACFGSLSCGLVAFLVARVGRFWHPVRAAIGGVAGGILLAISHVMWSQSVITETHTLTLFFVMLFLTISLLCLERYSAPRVCGLALTLGVGLSQSHMLVMLAPAFLLVLLFVDRRLCRDFSIAMVLVVAVLCYVFHLRALDPWKVAAAAFAMALVFSLSVRFLPRGALATLLVVLILCGLSLHAYLPLAGRGNPPMYFGHPCTWEGFRHVVTRGQYERIRPVDVFGNPLLFLDELAWYARLLTQQYILPVTLLGLLPIIRVSRFRDAYLKWWAVCLLTFFMFSVVLIIGGNPRGDIQDSLIQRVKFIPSLAVWGIWVGLGISMSLAWFSGTPLTRPVALTRSGRPLPE